MAKFNNRLGLLLLIFFAVACGKSENEENLRVLFIGNSYTYYNSSPEIFKALVKERFPERQIETKLISQGGYTLARHWKDAETLETIRTGEWDYVILQEQSKLGKAVMIDDQIYFGETDTFFEHVRLLNSEIRQAGAETVLFMTWSVRNRPEEQAILNYAYTSIAKELEAILAPVGMVWTEVRGNDGLNLYNDDGSHPSAHGSYLLASTLFATLLGESPEGLSGTVSGYRLSSRGQPGPDREILAKLTPEQARTIQEASWKVVRPLHKGQSYPDIAKPEPTYTKPVLTAEQEFTFEDLKGTWYGSSSYGYNYLGQVMEVTEENGKPKIELNFYSPHMADPLEILEVKMQPKQWDLRTNDALRNIKPTVSLALHNGQIKGLLSSYGNLIMYKHLEFDKNPVRNDLDLSVLAEQMEIFEKEVLKRGYVKAAVRHYSRFGKLIGKTYQPEQEYLNAQGYNYLQDNNLQKALEHFELAIHYYPQSVNVYDSYAEGLIKADRKEEALAVYTKAYELAKSTDYQNLEYIEENLNKLKNDLVPEISGESIPPPPPPSGGKR